MDFRKMAMELKLLMSKKYISVNILILFLKIVLKSNNGFIVCCNLHGFYILNSQENYTTISTTFFESLVN